MTDPLGGININEGERTHLREIIAPQKGDDYITSYYEVLRAIEQYTVYIEPTQDDLPDNVDTDWSLVGIAETEAEEFEGSSVHVYDGTEWVDTFQTIDDFVGSLEDRVSENEREISEVKDDLYSAAYIPQITSYPTEIEVGETIQVVANIVNNGRESGDQDILLKVEGTTVDSEDTVVLEANESQEVTLEWTPAEDYIGRTVGLTVETADQSDSRNSYVLEPAEFIITSVDAPSEIEYDSSAEISAEIRNTGEVDATQTVSITVDGSTHREPLSVDGGRSDSVDFEWDGTTSPSSHGYTVTVETEDETDDGTHISVLGPAYFEVDINSVTSGAEVGDTIRVDFDVENTGESSNSQEIELLANWSQQDTTSVSVRPGTSENMTLRWDTSSGDHGSNSLRVRPENGESDTQSVSIDDAAPTVSMSVRRTSIETPEWVYFDFDSSNVASYTVDWDSGSEATGSNLSSSIRKTWGSPGTYWPSVEVENETGQTATDSSAAVTVESPEPDFDITINDTYHVSITSGNYRVHFEFIITNNTNTEMSQELSFTISNDFNSDTVTDSYTVPGNSTNKYNQSIGTWGADYYTRNSYYPPGDLTISPEEGEGDTASF